MSDQTSQPVDTSQSDPILYNIAYGASQRALFPADPNARYAGTALETTAERSARQVRATGVATANAFQASILATGHAPADQDSQPAARRTRRIVRALAAGTWSALQTYGALTLAAYGYPTEVTQSGDIR